MVNSNLALQKRLKENPMLKDKVYQKIIVEVVSKLTTKLK